MAGATAPVALGYSNGANIAAAVMLLRPDVRAGGILLRAGAAHARDASNTLAGKAALMISGANDPIIPPAKAARLKAMLVEAGAEVDHRILPGGHQLSQADVNLARAWLEQKSARENPFAH